MDPHFYTKLEHVLCSNVPQQGKKSQEAATQKKNVTGLADIVYFRRKETFRRRSLMNVLKNILCFFSKNKSNTKDNHIGFVWCSRLLFIFLVLVFRLSSQNPEFINYSTKDGLLTDEVYNLFQDKKGYIWVFSPYGTVKYNGSVFKPVLKNLPFEESFIFAMYESESGKKWVANSNARIFEVRNDSAFMIRGLESATEKLQKEVSEITQLIVDDSLNIYVSSKGGSYKCVPKNGLYFPVDLSAIQKFDSVLIEISRVKNLPLLVTYRFKGDEPFHREKKERVYLKLDSKHFFRLPNSPHPQNVKNFKKYHKDLYFSYARLLGKISEQNQLLYINIGSLIVNYTKATNNHMWVGSLNNGLYELNEHDSIIHHYFQNITVNDILVDHQSGLWFSTPDQGLYHCVNTENNCFKAPEPLGTGLSFITRIGHELFIANKKGSVFVTEGSKLTEVREADNNTPQAIAKQGDEYIIAFATHFEHWSFLNGKLTQTKSKVCEKNYNVISKSKDTLIFVWRRGLTYVIKGKQMKEIDFQQKILCSYCYSDTFWFGTEKGIWQHKPKVLIPGKYFGHTMIRDLDTLVQPEFLKSSRGKIITRIVKGHSGDLWFCTRGNGLLRLKNGKLISYTIKDGLPANIVNDLNFTPDGAALLSTNKGLFLSEKENEFQNWHLIHPEEVQCALIFQKKIYASVRNGLVIINLKSLKSESENVLLNLSEIKIDTKQADSSGFHNLKSNQTIEFLFDLITFTDDKPPLKYFLHGPSADSGTVSDPVLKFSRLSPGNYTLGVYPVTYQGKAEEIRISFSVAPVFWQSALFRIIVLVVFILIAIVMVRIYRKREALKIKNEQLILEYKLIALRAQINPHFISNCLSAIQSLIKSDKTKEATFYVAKFGLLVRHILDFSSKAVITLEDELKLLGIYLELEQLRFDNKFTYEVSIDENISVTETHLPPLLLNPIVENAIWHGLLPVQKQKKGILKVCIKREGDNLAILIDDNGVGIGKTKKKTSYNKSKSYGLKITEQRLSNLNYLYKRTDARITLNDMNEFNDVNGGTRVTIHLPIISTLLQDEKD